VAGRAAVQDRAARAVRRCAALRRRPTHTLRPATRPNASPCAEWRATRGPATPGVRQWLTLVNRRSSANHGSPLDAYAMAEIESSMAEAVAHTHVAAHRRSRAGETAAAELHRAPQPLD
jgi:hypothetical protein